MKQRYMAFLAAGIAAAFLLPACGSRARQARADAEAISAAFEASLARLLENTRTNAELIGEAYAREGSLSLDTSGMGARSGRGGGYGDTGSPASWVPRAPMHLLRRMGGMTKHSRTMRLSPTSIHPPMVLRIVSVSTGHSTPRRRNAISGLWTS